MELIFYRDNSLASLLVRIATKKHRQPFGEVPGHVAICVGDAYYEALSTGVNRRYQDKDGVRVSVPIFDPDGTHETDARRWLYRQLGKRYDWWAIFADAVGMILPKRGRIASTTSERWDCSRLVAGALASAGMDIGAGRSPVSPNDLWLKARAWSEPVAREQENDADFSD